MNWRDLTPAELLDKWECLDMEQAAYVLGLNYRQGATKGSPNPNLAVKLVHSGKLRLIDPDQDRKYWTVSVHELRRYRDGGRRMSAVS